MIKHGWYQNIKRLHLYGLFIDGQFIGDYHNQEAPGTRQGIFVFQEPQFPANFNYYSLLHTTEILISLPQVVNTISITDNEIIPYFMVYKTQKNVYDFNVEDYPGIYRTIPIPRSFIEQTKKQSAFDLFLDETPVLARDPDKPFTPKVTYIPVGEGTFPWAVQQLIEGKWVTRRSARVPYFTDRDTYSWYLRPITPGNDLLPSGCRFDDLTATDWIIITPVDTFMA